MSSPKERPSTRAPSIASNPLDPLTTDQPSGNGSSPDSLSFEVALQVLLVALVTHRVGAIERAYFEKSIPVASAQALGTRFNPGDVCAEFARCAGAYLACALDGRLPGFGPMRLRYGLELARDLNARNAAHEALQSRRKRASAQADEALTLTRADERKAVQALRTITTGDASAAEQVSDAASAARTKGGKSRGLMRIADAVQYAREHVPVSVLNDAGLTPAVLDALRNGSKSVAETRAARDEKKRAAQTLRGELALPCGRLCHELKLLLAAARAARELDPTVPNVTSFVVQRAKKPEPAAPAAPPKPA